MDPKERPRLHARDHLPGGADPIDFAFLQQHTGWQQHILDSMPDAGGYWPLDDTDTAFMDDIGPNDRNGFYVNDPTLQVAPLIADGKAVAFHGASTTYAQVPINTGLAEAGSWTVGAWIETTQSSSFGIGSSSAQFVCCDDNLFRYFQFRLVPATGVVEAIAFDAGNAHNVTKTGAVVVNDGVRHLVAARYDAGADELTVWVDGVQDGAAVSLGFGPSVRMSDLFFGCRKVGSAFEDFYDGVLDEVFLYGDAADDTFMSGLYVLGFDASITGSKWLSGSGTPATSLGNNGDFYLDTSTGDVYQKVAGVWGSPIANLTGPSGGGTGPAGGVLDGSFPNPGLASSVAGAGLAETSDVLSVNVDNSTIEINTDTLRVKDAGVTAAKLSLSVSDLLAAVARVKVAVGGTLKGTRRSLNLIAGTGITISGSDDSSNEKVDVTISASGGGGSSTKYACVVDQKTANTDGGGFTSGAWQTRTLNTVQADPDSIVSLASNQITLQAGTYRIRASAPGAFVAQHKIRLRNITDGTTTIVGSSEYADNSLSGDQTRAMLAGRFTIAAAKAFEIQHQCTVTKAGNGFGAKSNYGEVEIYTIVEIEME